MNSSDKEVSQEIEFEKNSQGKEEIIWRKVNVISKDEKGYAKSYNGRHYFNMNEAFYTRRILIQGPHADEFPAILSKKTKTKFQEEVCIEEDKYSKVIHFGESFRTSAIKKMLKKTPLKVEVFVQKPHFNGRKRKEQSPSISKSELSCEQQSSDKQEKKEGATHEDILDSISYEKKEEEQALIRFDRRGCSNQIAPISVEQYEEELFLELSNLLLINTNWVIKDLYQYIITQYGDMKKKVTAALMLDDPNRAPQFEKLIKINQLYASPPKNNELQVRQSFNIYNHENKQTQQSQQQQQEYLDNGYHSIISKYSNMNEMKIEKEQGKDKKILGLMDEDYQYFDDIEQTSFQNSQQNAQNIKNCNTLVIKADNQVQQETKVGQANSVESDKIICSNQGVKYQISPLSKHLTPPKYITCKSYVNSIISNEKKKPLTPSKID